MEKDQNNNFVNQNNEVKKKENAGSTFDNKWDKILHSIGTVIILFILYA